MINFDAANPHYENISFWEKSPQLMQLVGFFDPKMVFFRLRKSQKEVKINICVSNLEVTQRRLLAITTKRNDDNSCDVT